MASVQGCWAQKRAQPQASLVEGCCIRHSRAQRRRVDFCLLGMRVHKMLIDGPWRCSVGIGP